MFDSLQYEVFDKVLYSEKETVPRRNRIKFFTVRKEQQLEKAKSFKRTTLTTRYDPARKILQVWWFYSYEKGEDCTKVDSWDEGFPPDHAQYTCTGKPGDLPAAASQPFPQPLVDPQFLWNAFFASGRALGVTVPQLRPVFAQTQSRLTSPLVFDPFHAPPPPLPDLPPLAITQEMYEARVKLDMSPASNVVVGNVQQELNFIFLLSMFVFLFLHHARTNTRCTPISISYT